MPAPQRARHSAARPPSISSVAAFAAAPAHVVRRPHRVACALFVVLVLLTLSALEIGGKKALSEPHSPSQDELAQVGGSASTAAGAQAASQVAPVARVGAAKRPVAEEDRAKEVDDRPAGREVVEEVLLDEVEPSVDEDGALPVCDKSVVFRFAGLHGFGSEVTLLLRVAAVASHFGYPVFIDTASWNYGAWDDYFVPLDSPFPPFSSPSDDAAPSPACRLPPSDTKRYKLALTSDEHKVAAGPDALDAPFEPRWTRRSHIVWSARDMDGLDATFLRLFADADELETLHREDVELLTRRKAKPAFLSPRRTLPAVHERAFRRLSELAELAWRPVDLVQDLVGELEERLALSDRGEGVTGAGSLLIGVHVRLGDKFLEVDHIGPAAYAPDLAPAPPSTTSPRGLHADLLTSYFAASIDSVHSLLALPSIAHQFSAAHSSKDRIRALLAATSSWASEDPSERPTLALMSDDDRAVEAFRAHPLAARFRIVGTAEAAPSSGEGEGEEERADGGGEAAEGKAAGDDKPQGGLLEVVEREPAARDAEAEEEQEQVRAAADEDDELLADKRSLPSANGTELAAQELGVRRVVGGPTIERKKRRGGKKRQVDEIPAGFNETSFNSLPLAARISSARLFVRDLTVLARRSDALVVTGSSNVGRLMMLLFEASRDERGEGRKREMRSLDARWFPTARFT
ncbi:hypothetical protein JCM3775_005157 [Rhodotorula graminis]